MKKLIPGFLILLSASCDCLQDISVEIVDKQTGKLLDGVHIYTPKNLELAVTNDEGYYGTRKISGGLFECPGENFVLKKEGYKTKRIHVKNAEPKTVKMVALKK